MAEGRMLKKAIADSNKLAKCKDRSKVVWFMMLPHTDIEGRVRACPDIVKGRYLTKFKYSVKSIQTALEELHKEKLIVLYVIGEDQFAEYTRFEDFQTLNPSKEAKTKIPAPLPENSRELQRTPENSALSLSKDKLKISKDKGLLVFGVFRKKYPGKKTGNKQEFSNFIYRATHPKPGMPPYDWQQELPKLLSAIESQITNRETAKATDEFVPDWKHLKTWINNQCWTEENSRITSERDCADCGSPYTAGHKYTIDPRTRKRIYKCQKCRETK